MNYELFIARRLVSQKTKAATISRPIVRIAVGGVALGFAVMILAIAIVTGFKREIREKVVGFGSHIQVSNFDENNSYETQPVLKNDSFKTVLSSIPGIKHVQEFGLKAGIIKTAAAIEGVVVKGIGKDFDWHFFQDKLVEGRVLQLADSGKSNEVMISRITATRLHLKTGDALVTYFIQRPPRARRFQIAGIYETGLEEFDSKYIFCDLAQLRQLNDWLDNQTGGYELTVSDFGRIDDIGEAVYEATPSDLNARTIKEIYPQVFDWLGLQDINGIIIIVLMLIVSVMNMISALLIIILERVQLIGILKSEGATNFSVRKLFLYIATSLVGRGMLIGNFIGCGLALFQYLTHALKLDQQSYYISYIPVHLSWENVLLLNAGTLCVCSLMMLLPTLIITKITPLQALRFN